MTRKEAIERKCIDCSGGWDEKGKINAGVRAEIAGCLVGCDCPLYSFRPYKDEKKSQKPISDERRQQLADNLKKARAARGKKNV